MKFNTYVFISCILFGVTVGAPILGYAHGDVTPQAVDTHTLPQLGEELRKENPYRGSAAATEATSIGKSAYTQNCARCHGLEAVSGGMSPDLRELDNECVDKKNDSEKLACFKEVDQYFMDFTMAGKVRNGAVKMPSFKATFSQEAVWAIKTYLETRRGQD